MTPAFWAALGSGATALTALAGLIILACRVSYQHGEAAERMRAISERLEKTEAKVADQDCQQQLAVLTEKLSGFASTLTEVAHDVKNLLTGKVQPARRGVQ